MLFGREKFRYHAPSRKAIQFAAASLVILCAWRQPVEGANRYWITGSGGNFNNTASWSTAQGGSGGASVPVAADDAIFAMSTTYTVTLGGAVTNNSLSVNNGNVTLDLESNTYTTKTGVRVGSTGVTGRLTVRDGVLGVDSAGDLVQVGPDAGSTGFLTVTTAGQLGSSALRADLSVGNYGTGTFALDNNGLAFLRLVSMGLREGAKGTATISGPNAVADVENSITIGGSGEGTMTVQTGGTLNSAGVGILGAQVGALGTLTVTGGSSNWTQAGSLTIGQNGSGSVTVQSSGLATSNGAVTLGSGGTGIGVASVTGAGSIWNMTGALTVGSAGTANLVVSSAGKLTTAGSTAIGSIAGSDGFLAISGAGSRWTAASVTVGGQGVGRFQVLSAGQADLSAPLVIGAGTQGSGEVTVSGTDSKLNITGAISVATSGKGTLMVDTGGSVSATGALTIGDPTGTPVGTVNFDGGTISVGGFTRAAGAVFNWTDGVLQLVGGNLNNAGANLVINGNDAADAPTLRLTSGAISLTTDVPNLTVGGSRQGGVSVIGGSRLQTVTTAIGAVDTGAGVVLVEGRDSLFSTSGDLGVGGSTTAAGGTGVLTVNADGMVSVGGTMKLWSGGTVNMNGGTLAITNLAPNGGKFAFNSGRLQFLGNFTANASALDAILGVSHTLSLGRTIDLGNNAFNIATNLVVDGGTIQGATLAFGATNVVTIQNSGVMTFTGAITNPAGSRVFVGNGELRAGTTLTNAGELRLAGGATTIAAASVNNTGLISGNAVVNSVVTNSTSGQIRVASDERLQFVSATGSNSNNGEINVDGGGIEFSRVLNNSTASPSTGLIVARDATLRFNGGLSNSGSLTFATGVSNVFGDVSNLNNLATPGRIVVTAGAQANFFDDVVNSGSIQVSASGGLESTAVFLGSFSGNGVTGSGHVFMEGDVRPGFSPGTMAFGGDVSFGPTSVLEIELGGLTAGTQYDRVTVAESAVLGGSLEVSLINGFTPALGSSFQILTASQGITGAFVNSMLPSLATGLGWNVDYTATGVQLSVITATQQPGDFNNDGRVDGRDLLLWQRGGSPNPGSTSDLAEWKSNYGDSGLTAASTAVPEPSSLVLVVLTSVLAVIYRRENSRNL
jgi:T5SS/PEP-CTERM-associated repeat protein